MATITYYLVRDEGETLIAIHRTPDSAAATLEKLSKNGKHQRLEVEKVSVDQWGVVLTSVVTFRCVCES